MTRKRKHNSSLQAPENAVPPIYIAACGAAIGENCLRRQNCSLTALLLRTACSTLPLCRQMGLVRVSNRITMGFAQLDSLEAQQLATQQELNRLRQALGESPAATSASPYPETTLSDRDA